MLYISPFLSSSETKVVATFLTLDLYFTNCFLCHCKYVQDPAPYAENVYVFFKKKVKIFVGFFTKLLRPCYVEIKAVSVRKGPFLFALDHFLRTSGSLLDDGWQLLGSLHPLGVGRRGTLRKEFLKTCFGWVGVSFVRSANCLGRKNKTKQNLQTP